MALHPDGNGEEIENLEAEIEYLEKKLGVGGDKKKKDKLMKQIEGEGLGVGFLSFLDGIAGKVKDSSYAEALHKHGGQEYDFNDDAQEVLLDFPEMDKMMSAPGDAQQHEDGDSNHQEGFSDMESDEDAEDYDD